MLSMRHKKRKKNCCNLKEPKKNRGYYRITVQLFDVARNNKFQRIRKIQSQIRVRLRKILESKQSLTHDLGMVAKKTFYGISMVAKKSMRGFSWFPRTPRTKLVFTTTGKNRLKTYLPVDTWVGIRVSCMILAWLPKNHLWYFNGCQEFHDAFFTAPKNARTYWIKLVFDPNW